MGDCLMDTEILQDKLCVLLNDFQLSEVIAQLAQICRIEAVRYGIESEERQIWLNNAGALEQAEHELEQI